MKQKIINENKIRQILHKTRLPSKRKIWEILKKAERKLGLSLEEVGFLVNLKSPRLIRKLFSTAGKIKEEIYGERLVFFAPLYISDFCVNNCAYCNFHSGNQGFKRKKLTPEEIAEQTKIIINMGHKRMLIEFGEDPVHNNINYVVSAIKKIYSIKTKKGNIRRVNVNIAATSVDNYKKLKKAHIGTYQLFQETYHRSTYLQLHRGLKADYDRQIRAHIRAYKAGIDDLGLGVLFGLYDWRFEILCLVAHAQYLDRICGVGPHTISVPRVQPAPGVDFKPQYRVDDADFLKLIAVLRLAVPYTGMIISTRETPETRQKAFKIGISQASAASCTVTGGYGKRLSQPQFVIRDERPLQEVVEDAMRGGLLPSFCTACYRLGRTGKAFMDISKAGEIHNYCRPNGLLTFAEYLEDFSKDGIYEKGKKLIRFYLHKIKDDKLRNETQKRLVEISQGRRDLYF